MDKFFFANEKVCGSNEKVYGSNEKVCENLSLQNLSLQNPSITPKDTLKVLNMRKKAFQYCQFANKDTKMIKKMNKYELEKKFSFLY